MLKRKTIGFIGAGSMAEAMISGIVSSNLLPSNQIIASNRNNIDRLASLEKMYGIRGVTKNHLLISELDIIVLAMKPKDIEIALEDLKPFVKPHQLILSVIAGVSTAMLEERLPNGQAIIRVMPNTSSTIGESATAISLGKNATAQHRNMTELLLSSIGKVYVIKEEQMDIFTGVAGSGPAYFYYLMEHMEKTAKDAGLDPTVTREVVAQTIFGAAKMIMDGNETPSQLRKNVTSPNGTTAAGLSALRKNGGGSAISAAIKSATHRSKELCEEKNSKELIYN
ncbi:pyrroline-5-carboxylate reductase [Bacillus alkalisoli]|uniref:pyrroline-5-carboxylate reductase n=1 Tax=Bacillus alkalisoli TaxID=2011008 RepID=UPI000C24AB92|nr:pyrroline-5-carboxylate reductase [Bacillus alkalisoli]